MSTTSIVARIASVICATLVLLGCNGGDDGSASSGGGSSGGGSGGGGFDSRSGNPDADKALMAKIEQHWTKTENGWTTELVEQLPLNPPVRVLKQYREFKYTLAPETLSEADKLNGIEWKSFADFGSTSMRYWREEDNYEYPKGWSQWQQEPPTYQPAVYKRNGQWFVEDRNFGSMFEGTKPTDVPST